MTSRIFLLLSFLFHGAYHCAAQQRELDSLLGVLKHYPKEDTIRLQLLNDVAYNYSRIDPAKGLAVANEAILLAQKLNNTKKLAAATTYKAMNYGGLGEDSLSLEFYKQALAIHQQVNDRLRVATTYNNIAIALVNLSDYSNALACHEKAFSVFEELGDKLRMGNSLNNRGVIYLYLSDYRQALKYYLQALGIFEQLDNRQVMANTLTNIGLVYDHLSDFPKAIAHHQRAYDIYEASGDKHGMVNALGNLGNVLHNMGHDDEALAQYRKALAISQSTGDKRGIASNYGNLGIVYNSMGKFDEALDYLGKSLAINRQSGDKKRISGDLNEIGKAYLHAPAGVLQRHGIAPARRLPLVIDYQRQSLDMAKSIGNLDMQREAWSVLHQAYEQQGAHAHALNAYRQYVLLRDSIVNTTIQQDVARKEIQFEYDKKEFLLKAQQEREQAAATAALNRQRLLKNMVLGMAAVLAAAGIVSFVFYKRRRDADAQRREAEFRLQSAETEMQVLRLQMNPHFIFNSLNSINHYIDKHDTEKATLFTTRFAKLMRMTLEHSRREEIPLADDLAALELYMQLEALRMQDAFAYEIIVDEGIDPETTMVPPMMLQPLVENSIWHGLSRQAAQGRILIHIRKENGMINCMVEDNGAGRKVTGQLRAAAENAPHKKSLGIAITRDRLSIINKLKNAGAGLRLTDLDKGLRAEVMLPLQSW